MQKLITKTINHIEYTTPTAKKIHDVYVYNKTILFYFKRLLIYIYVYVLFV